MRSRLVTALSLSIALVLSASPASAYRSDEREDLVKKQEQNNTRIEKLQSSLEGVNVDLQETYLKLEQTRNKIPVAQANLDAARADLAAALREQEAVNAQLDAATAELDSITAAIAEDDAVAASTQNSLNELARSAYRGDTTRSAVELWTGSATAEQFLSGYSVIDSVARAQSSIIVEAQTALASNRNRQVRQEAVQDEIVDLQAQADALVVTMEAKEADAKAKSDALLKLEKDEKALAKSLEKKKSSHEDSISKLKASNKSTAATIAEIDAENARRAEEARQKAAEEARKKAEREKRAKAETDRIAREAARKAEQNVAPAPSKGSAPAPVTTAPAPVSNTMFIPPVPAPVYVTSPFGMRWYPITGGHYMHNGVDLRSVCGEAQVAAAAGVVQSVRPATGNGTHGNQVFVNHGIINGHSYVTVYNHLSGFAVSTGQSVAKGQAIGYTGMTGAVTGCHVHFEIWRDGTVIDPMTQPGFTRRYG